MGNNFKRFLAFVLAFAMVFAYVPANAFAAEAGETTYVAKIGETKYASVMDALLAAAEIESSETVKVELLADSREVMTKDRELLIKSNVELVSATGDPVVAKFYNNGTKYDFVFNSATGFDGKTFTIGKDVTFYLEDRTIWAGYYGNNVDIIVNGILWAGYQYWNGANTTVTATGTLKSAEEALVLRRGATLKADGGKIEASYFSMLSGKLVAENGATVTCGPVWITNNGNYVNEGNVTITVKGSTLTSNSNLKSASEHPDGVTIVIDNSQVEFQEKNHGGSVLDANTTLNVIGKEAKLNMKNVTNAGTIHVSGGAQVVTETVDNAGSVIVESGSSFVDQDGALKLPVAKIGTETFDTLAAALAAANAGDEIVLLADATPALTSQRAITKAAVIDLGGKTLTLTEDDLYFGTTTFKNGTIVVDPSVKPSTAVFWMFANQTLTFDNVKVVATGVTGTYLIGLEGTNSNLNLLNGSEILIENTTALDLDVICVNGSSDNKIVIADSKVNVTNLDGRVLFRGNYTIKGSSELNLDGITKAGIRIEAGQTLAIEDTAKVVITGEPRDGGIHLTDATATYTKAETATVDATVNAPAPAAVAKIGEQGYETLEAALAAACADHSITRIEILSDYVQTSVENTEDYYDIIQNLVIGASQKVTVSGCGFAVRVMDKGASLTIEENVTIEGLDIVANGYGTTGQNMTINGTMKAKSLKQWTTDGTITVAETGKVVLGYGDGQFDMAYGNGTVTINGSGDKTAAQFKAGYSGTRGNGNTLNLNNTYFEGGAWFMIEGLNGTFNVNNSILKVSGGDAAGYMTINGSGNVIKLTNGAKLVVDRLTIGEGNTLVVGDNCTLEVKTLTNNGKIQVVGENATLNIEKLSGKEITLMDGAIVKDSTIGGSVFVAGKVIFRGANTVNMLYDYGTLTDYYGTTANMEWTVEAGSSLTFTDKARYGLGYGDQVTIYGSLTDALNARETLTEDDISFFTHGLVAQESKDWNCESSLTVENAYVVIGSNNSFGNKPGNYGGTYTFNFSNAVLDASRITFYEALSTAEFNFTNTDAKVGTFMTRDPDSVFTLTNTKLVSTTTANGNDEGNYHAGTLVLNNSSLTYSAPLVMENGTLTVGAGSSLTAPSITGTGKIIIDATDMTAGEVTAINADASGFTGTLEVINNGNLEAQIVNGKIVLTEKPVASITTAEGTTYYKTIAEAMAAAQAGDVVTIFAGTYAVPSMKAGITVVGEVNADGTPAVLLEGTLSGTLENLTLKNLHIKGGNAQRWAYAKGDLVFENVIFEATSVYALHFDGITAGSNLLYKDCTIIGWAAMGGSPASCVFDGCTIKDNGTYGVIRTFFDAEIKNCTFDVDGANPNDAYQDGIHAVEGAKVTVNNCTNANGAMKDLVNIHAESVVVLDGVEIRNVAKVTSGEKVTYYETIAAAMNAAVAGDTVTILAGEYTQSLSVNKAITVVGETDAEGKNLVKLNGGISITADGATVKNLTASNPSTTGYNMTLDIHAKNVLVEGCEITDVNAMRYAETSGEVTLRDCILTATGTWAIHFDGKEGGEVTVEGCTVTGWIAFGGSLEKVTLLNSTFDAGNYAGGRVYNDTLSIDGCTFEAGYKLDLDGTGKTVTVTNTTVGGESAVKLFNSDDLVGKNAVTIDNDSVAYVAKIGTTYYATLEEALANVATWTSIQLVADATLDYNAREAYGRLDTEEIVIDGKGFTLTLNQKDSDWASIGMKNPEGKLTLKNMTIEKTGYGDTTGAWNTHAIIFSCNVEMNNVTVNNGIAVQNGATLKNVTINEAGDYYGLWINGNGQTVTMNGGAINATNGRGIKIADQYIDAPEFVTLKVTDTKFNTAKKAAVLVTSTAGAKITATNVDITNVAADNTNFVWVDEDRAANYGNVEVTGATKGQEAIGSFAAAIMDGEKVVGYYKTLAEAIAAAEAGDTIKVLHNIDLAEGITNTKKVTLDLNGKTITGTDNITGSFGLITNKGELTITGNGKMTLVATNNRGWNAYSSVISNTVGGKLIVESGTIEHLGGTDMAYAIDNLTNGKGTYAETVINGGTIKSTYRAVRQFLNGVEAQNILTVNGGTIEGANKSIWMQDPSKNANSGKLTVGENAKLVGDVYLSVTAGSTEWPVDVAIANAAFERGTVLYNNVPATYVVENVDGTWGVNNGLKGSGTEEDPYQISTLSELILFRDSVNAGETKYSASGVYVALTADIDMTGENWVGIGSATADHGFMGNFDGNGYTIKNLTITDPALDAGYAYAGLFSVTEGTADAENVIKNLIIENVTISTTGDIVAAAIAYPYYTTVENVIVCGDINITGGNYTAGALAYTRRCVNASNVTVSGNEGSTITGAQVVGGVISDIQMNGGLTANYSDFSASGVTITGTKNVGGICGIIATQTLNGAAVENVTLVCDNANVGTVAGCLGGTSTISNVTVENVTGATALIGATYDKAEPVAAKIGDTYYATLEAAVAAANGAEVALLCDSAVDLVITAPVVLNLNNNAYTGKVTLSDTAATLTAAENLNVVSDVEGYEVKHVDGKYQLVEEKQEVQQAYNKTVYQIGLIEPWALKVNVRVTDAGFNTIDYSTVTNYGVYAIRRGQLSDPEMDVANMTIDTLKNEANVIHFSKENGGATQSGNYVTFIFNEGLYTYRLAEDVIWVLYYETNEGTFVTAVQERNLFDLMNERKDSTSTTYGAEEKQVYADMVELFNRITDYRSDFENLSDVERQNTATLASTDIAFAEAATDGKYGFARVQQIGLVEPWGMRLNTRIYSADNTTGVVDYNSLDDYGVIVFHDKSGAVDLENMNEYFELLNYANKNDVYVFSDSQGTTSVSGKYAASVYNKDIFTYEMDTVIYYMFFAKDGDSFYYSQVYATNIKDLAAERSVSTSSTYTQKEKDTYAAMVALCESVAAYRDWYYQNNQ